MVGPRMCQRFARAPSTIVPALLHSLLPHATRELGQHGVGWGGGWGSGLGALGSHGRSRWFEPNHAHSEPWRQVSAEFAHAEVAN